MIVIFYSLKIRNFELSSLSFSLSLVSSLKGLYIERRVSTSWTSVSTHFTKCCMTPLLVCTRERCGVGIFTGSTQLYPGSMVSKVKSHATYNVSQQLQPGKARNAWFTNQSLLRYEMHGLKNSLMFHDGRCPHARSVSWLSELEWSQLQGMHFKNESRCVPSWNGRWRYMVAGPLGIGTQIEDLLWLKTSSSGMLAAAYFCASMATFS